MLSCELAKKLEDVGLVWEPKKGDWYAIPEISINIMLMDYSLMERYRLNDPADNWENAIKRYVFLPRLDQLIASMEERGYRVESTQDACYIFHPETSPWWQKFPAENRTNAAGEALLWILQQEQAVD